MSWLDSSEAAESKGAHQHAEDIEKDARAVVPGRVLAGIGEEAGHHVELEAERHGDGGGVEWRAPCEEQDDNDDLRCGHDRAGDARGVVDAELDGDAANDDTPPLAGDDESQDNSPDGGHAPTTDTVADTESKAPLPPRDDDAGMTAPDGEPDTAPGERAAPQNETENNAVAKTTVAVDEADPEPEADAPVAGRSQVNE